MAHKTYPWRCSIRNAAYEAGEIHYSPNKLCKRGHARRRVMDGQCLECKNTKTKEFWVKNGRPKIAVEYSRAWRQKNPDKQKLYDKSRPIDKLEKRKAWNKTRRRTMPAYVNAEIKKEIREIYQLCQQASQLSGILHHVDHIIPLKGKNMCGLHVPDNLQIIPWNENLSKGNKLENNS